MKKIKPFSFFFVFTLFLSLSSCKESSIAPQSTDMKDAEITETKATEKKTQDSNLLCKVNGVDWAYSKASGIIDKHPKSGELTAIITFTKKLYKGSKSIQLYYDGISFQLEKAALNLKFPKKGGGLLSGYYTLSPETKFRSPNSIMSGSLDLSDGSTASGTAEIKNLNINHEKDKLENPEDATVSVSGLKFSGIGYSDLDMVFKSLSNTK